jgi:hypothetical protein
MAVTLIQYLRVRDRRLLALLALFAFQALALWTEWWDFKKEVYQTGACAAGLVLLLMISLRHHAPAAAPNPPAPDAPPEPPRAA